MQRKPFKGEAGDQLVSGWKEGAGEPQVALCVSVCVHTVSLSVRALCLCLRVCTVSVFVRVPVSVRVHCVCVFALCVSVQALCLRSYLVFDRRRSCFYPGYHTCAGNSAVYYRYTYIQRLYYYQMCAWSGVGHKLYQQLPKSMLTGLCAKDIASSWFKVCAGGARRK